MKVFGGKIKITLARPSFTQLRVIRENSMLYKCLSNSS